MTDIIIAVAVVAAIGLICAVILALADKFMGVKVDEREKEVRSALPGANCGACGFTGCDGYAKALVENPDLATNLCIPGADAVARRVSEILGREFQDVVEQVAFVHCLGDCDAAKEKHNYEGIQSCAAATMLYGGSGACTCGCVGLGDCANACPSGAICIENGIAHVDTRKCTGCGVCVKTCPHHLITLFSDLDRVAVTCSNTEKGAVTRQKCTNGCIGCKKCEKNCPTGAVTVVNNLAVIDYDKCTNCGLCAENCPVKCIKYANYSGVHRFVQE